MQPRVEQAAVPHGAAASRLMAALVLSATFLILAPPGGHAATGQGNGNGNGNVGNGNGNANNGNNNGNGNVGDRNGNGNIGSGQGNGNVGNDRGNGPGFGGRENGYRHEDAPRTPGTFQWQWWLEDLTTREQEPRGLRQLLDDFAPIDIMP